VQKTYNSTGTKTATVIITSNSISSIPISCASSVIITSSNGGWGGGGWWWGGGGGWILDTKKPVVEDIVDKKETLPPLDAAPPEDTQIEIPKKDISSIHPECHLPENPTFQDAKDYLVCDNVITKRDTESAYEYERNTYRKELLAIATNIHLKHPDAQEKIKLSKLSGSLSSTLDTSSNYSYHFLDIGIAGQPEWVRDTVDKGIVFGLISNQNQYFRPDDAATRAESFAMLMKSVCMDPNQSIQKNWQQRVYEVALRNGITSRSWRDFRPDAPILRQELFLITARLDRWKDQTGGCDTYWQVNTTASKSKKNIIEEHNSHPSCSLPDNPSPQEAQKYLVCDNLLTPTTIVEKFDGHTQRSTVLGMSLEMFFKHRIIQKKTETSEILLQFLDIGTPGQEPWIQETVTKSVKYGLIANEKTYFRPTDHITRWEALSLLMNSVCMHINTSIQHTWEERLYEIALRNGITQKSWEDFDVNEMIERWELLIITAKLDQWKDETGGCDTYPQIVPPSIEPILESAPPEPKKSTQITPSNTQKPGTFALLYENETERVYTYIVKSGGIPDGVRAQYLRIFWGTKNTAQRVSIHDIAGVEFSEDRWLLGWELVYVTFKK
jgi:S-layer homology domain